MGDGPCAPLLCPPNCPNTPSEFPSLALAALSTHPHPLHAQALPLKCVAGWRTHTLVGGPVWGVQISMDGWRVHIVTVFVGSPHWGGSSPTGSRSMWLEGERRYTGEVQCVGSLHWGVQSSGLQIHVAGRRKHILKLSVQWGPDPVTERRAHTLGGCPVWSLYAGRSSPVGSRSLWLEGKRTHWESVQYGCPYTGVGAPVQWDPDPCGWKESAHTECSSPVGSKSL